MASDSVGAARIQLAKHTPLAYEGPLVRAAEPTEKMHLNLLPRLGAEWVSAAITNENEWERMALCRVVSSLIKNKRVGDYTAIPVAISSEQKKTDILRLALYVLNNSEGSALRSFGKDSALFNVEFSLALKVMQCAKFDARWLKHSFSTKEAGSIAQTEGWVNTQKIDIQLFRKLPIPYRMATTTEEAGPAIYGFDGKVDRVGSLDQLADLGWRILCKNVAADVTKQRLIRESKGHIGVSLHAKSADSLREGKTEKGGVFFWVGTKSESGKRLVNPILFLIPESPSLLGSSLLPEDVEKNILALHGSKLEVAYREGIRLSAMSSPPLKRESSKKKNGSESDWVVQAKLNGEMVNIRLPRDMSKYSAKEIWTNADLKNWAICYCMIGYLSTLINLELDAVARNTPDANTPQTTSESAGPVRANNVGELCDILALDQHRVAVSPRINPTRRSYFINSLANGLIDLASILGIPPQALALVNGRGDQIGFSIGYPIKQKVAGMFLLDDFSLHLRAGTRDPALAHEMAHAIDASLSINPDRFSSTNEGSRLAVFLDRLVHDIPGIAERSRLLDGQSGTGKVYFAKREEIFARIFEQYIADAGAEIGIHNDFLAKKIKEPNRNSNENFEKIMSSFPYLLEGEKAIAYPALSAFMQQIGLLDPLMKQGVAISTDEARTPQLTTECALESPGL